MSISPLKNDKHQTYFIEQKPSLLKTTFIGLLALQGVTSTHSFNSPCTSLSNISAYPLPTCPFNMMKDISVKTEEPPFWYRVFFNLFDTIGMGNIDYVNYYLKEETKPNFYHFYAAIEYCDPSILKLLIEADTQHIFQKVSDRSLDTMLTIACRSLIIDSNKKRIECLKVLLDAGQNPNDSSFYGLPLTIVYKNIMEENLSYERGFEAIKLLLSYGADPELTDYNGESLLDLLKR